MFFALSFCLSYRDCIDCIDDDIDLVPDFSSAPVPSLDTHDGEVCGDPSILCT